MGVIKIETFDVDVTSAASQTHALSNSVGSLSSGFVRRTTSIDKQSGPTGSTGNANANIACGAAYLSGVSTVSFRQDSTTSQKIVGEVWRYTGTSGGADEFIVRGRHTVTLTGTTTGSTAVSGISSVDKCIPFWTGSTQTATSVNDYDASTVAVWLDASGNIQVERGSSTGTLVVYVTVVEFTGSNWSVGHVKSASHDTAAETDITIRANSLATTGTFDVGDWSNATIIEASIEGDTSETGLSDNLGCWTTGASTTQASFYLQQDSNARNDGVSYAHILAHQGLDVNRGSNTNYGEGNGTYVSVPWPAGASTSSNVDELAVEWFSDTSGVGTAHARGRLSAQILTASTMNSWVHRSGNTVRIDYGVVDLTAVDGTTFVGVTDVDTDEVLTNTQTNVVVTGAAFEATQGTGLLELVENADYTGIKIVQSIDSWSDTSIQFDVASGALTDTNCYLFVNSDSGGRGFIPVQVGNPPETYQEALGNLSPAFQHYWTFQNTYADEVGTATANNSSGGTPTFSTTPIVKGDTHSLLLNGTTEYISCADQSDMNTSSSATRRMMSGWIMMDRITQAVSVVWEEGAQVNNYAWLIGFGNSLMIQFADDGGDYVQIYFPVTLTPNRPYHVYMEFNGSGQNGGVCRGLLDGIPNVLSNGNTWEQTTFPSHSGNISWGHEGVENLQVGDSRGVDNVDIAFATPVACYYAHFISLQNNEYSDTQIREQMFEKGALSTVTIANGTEAAMQALVDAQAETLFTDYPCAIEIGACLDGEFEITLDNITFEDRVSMQIRYMGADTLTLVLENGSEIDADKIGAPYGGTVEIINSPTLTVTVLDFNDSSPIENARVYMTAASGGIETEGDVLLAGLTNASGQLTGTYRYTSDQPVGGRVRRASTGALYKTGSISSTITSIGVDVTILMIRDE